MWTELFRPQRGIALIVHANPEARARAAAQAREIMPKLDVVQAQSMHEALDLATWRDVDFVAAAETLPDGTAADLFRVLELGAHGRAIRMRVITPMPLPAVAAR